MGLHRLELGAVFQHREHDDGESACERNPRLAYRRSPGDTTSSTQSATLAQFADVINAETPY